MEIGKIIKQQRNTKNLTQQALANDLFVSRQLISKWENGRSYPDLQQLIQLSDYFELSLDELMRGDKKMIRKLNVNLKKSQLYVVVIFILLAGILWKGYDSWRNSIIQLTPDDIEITSLTVSEDANIKELNTATGKQLTLPADVSYTIKFKLKKPFAKIVQGSYYGSDKNNLYVDMRAQPALTAAADQQEHTFVILSDAKLYKENDSIDLDENYQPTTVKNKDIKILDLSDTKQALNAQLADLKSWLLIDRKDIDE